MITEQQFVDETQRLMDAAEGYGLHACFRSIVRAPHWEDDWTPMLELMVTPNYVVRVVWAGAPKKAAQIYGQDLVRIELQTPQPTLGAYGHYILTSYDVRLSEVVAKAFGELRALKAECQTNVNALRERRS
jgi:hypothetical protein